MPLYETPDGVLETLEWGEGPEQILLLHAAASSPYALAELAECLASPARRVIAPMLNGYGRTVMNDTANPIEAHLKAAAACAGICPAERRITFGHSMGGLIAFLAASRGFKADAIVLYEPIVIGALNLDCASDRAARDWDRALVRVLEEALAAGNPEAGVAAFVEGWNETDWAGIPADARTRLIGTAAILAGETRAVCDCIIEPEAFSRIAGPVALLNGDASPDLPRRIARRLAVRLPDARTFELAGAGHMGPVLAPALVAKAVEEFLDTLGSGFNRRDRTVGRP